MSRPFFATLALAALTAASASAQDIALPEEVATACESGVEVAADAVSEVKIAADGTEAVMLDTAGVRCAGEAALPFCGSGGCTLFATIGEKSWRWQADGWRVIDWDGMPVLLIRRDGGWCGGAGAQVCHEALTWSAGSFLTVMSGS